MKVVNTIRIASMAGLGPAAWDQDIQRMSMHPPLPGHVEYVSHSMHRLHHKHHIVHRNHPENDCDETVVAREIPWSFLLPLLAGKEYLRRRASKKYAARPGAVASPDHRSEVGQSDPVYAEAVS